jgi:hypothetical protein
MFSLLIPPVRVMARLTLDCEGGMCLSISSVEPGGRAFLFESLRKREKKDRADGEADRGSTGVLVIGRRRSKPYWSNGVVLAPEE